MPVPDYILDNIIDSITHGSCILILGSEFQQPLKAELLTYLGYPENKNIEYHDGDFFYFQDKAKLTVKNRIGKRIQGFYNEHEIPDLYKKLARIPFASYVSLNPDILLNRAFDALAFDYEFAYYCKGVAMNVPVEQLLPDKPLIYNLMGSINNYGSMILTQEDSYDYLMSVLDEYKFDDGLKQNLRNMENIVFLGVSFDRWYFKFLIKLLGIQGIEQFAFGKYENLDNASKLFCESHLDITFIDDNVEEFVDVLLERCAEDEVELRKPLRLEEMIEKLNFLREEEAITSDLTKKFELKQRIPELERQIDDLRTQINS
ncbi:MAG: SIR2 family protein [Bernardetiaceae bacterium]|nr:SIR2 family protein [Bernardetiaceae bacterium]